MRVIFLFYYISGTIENKQHLSTETDTVKSNSGGSDMDSQSPEQMEIETKMTDGNLENIQSNNLKTTQQRLNEQSSEGTSQDEEMPLFDSGKPITSPDPMETTEAGGPSSTSDNSTYPPTYGGIPPEQTGDIGQHKRNETSLSGEVPSPRQEETLLMTAKEVEKETIFGQVKTSTRSAPEGQDGIISDTNSATPTSRHDDNPRHIYLFSNNNNNASSGEQNLAETFQKSVNIEKSQKTGEQKDTQAVHGNTSNGDNGNSLAENTADGKDGKDENNTDTSERDGDTGNSNDVEMKHEHENDARCKFFLTRI